MTKPHDLGNFKPMNLLQVQRASKHFGTKVLFEDVSVSINDNEHIGVIGPNGAGKTTFFKVLVGKESLDSGDIIKAQGLRIGYLEQESEWALDQSSEEYLEQNCTKPIWDLKQIGLGLGLTQNHFEVPLRSLSGGYRMRMKLLYLIGQEPSLMLLDEPTNFLDLESILALETFLQDYKGAFLLISHDREFLRRTTEATLEIEAGDITKFPGHIDDYFEQKEQLKQILAAQAANLQAKRKHIEDFVNRFRAKASKARQAQSRMKQLEKMEKIEIKALPVRARIKIPPPIHTGKETLSLVNAQLGYPDKTVLKNVNLRLERGSRLGVVGFNGAGKSTLLKSLAGRLPLQAGTSTLGYQVTLSYFAQHVAEDLNLEDTVIEALERKAHKDIVKQDVLNIAGSLLFSGDDVHKKVKVLSGGEKSRVALGQILLQKSPFLIMDEPTNHLDFDTVEALTEVLSHYEGTLVIVSHDRSFIGRISNKILEIRDGTAEIYPGTYDDYVWSLEKGVLKEKGIQKALPLSKKSSSATSGATVSTPAASGATTSELTVPEVTSKFNYRDESKRLNSQIRELEKSIGYLERSIETNSLKRDQLNHELLTAQGPKAQELAKQLADCSRAIEHSEEYYLEQFELLESKKLELKQLKG